MLYTHALNTLSKIEAQINSIEERLQKRPAGKLICSRTQTRYKWFHSDGKQYTYIPKKQRPLAEKLALRTYFSLKLKYLQREKRAIEFYLRHHPKDGDPSTYLLTEHPEYQKLLSKYFQPVSKELELWMNAPFISNPNHPEKLIHHSPSGHILRSKSEVLIDMTLFRNKIPFRYEAAIQLGNIILYPDFTIRHPKTGDTYYWEHFGLADDPGYIKKTTSKLRIYMNHGIIPSINLITTFETENHPLDICKVEDLIKEFFVDELNV